MRKRSLSLALSALTLDALTRSLRHAEQVAAAVLVDAKNENARQFDAKYGFQAVAPDARRMFLPMRTVAKLLEAHG